MVVCPFLLAERRQILQGFKMGKFSDRHGYQSEGKAPTYREDATQNLREAAVLLAEEQGLLPGAMLSILCRELLVAPDQSNWSQYPNIYQEIISKVRNFEWFHVYDFI